MMAASSSVGLAARKPPASVRRLYLSYSLTAAQLPLLEQLAFAANLFRLELSAPQRPWDPPSTLPPHAGQALWEADCVVFLVARGGEHSLCATLEAGFVRNVCPEKPTIWIFEKDAQRPGGLEYISPATLDPHWLWESVHQARHRIQKQLSLDESSADRLTGFSVMAIGLMTVLLRGGALPSAGAPRNQHPAPAAG